MGSGPRSRRRFLANGPGLVGAGLLAGCGALPDLPSPYKKLPRIGFLSPNAAGSLPTTDAFLDGLREPGYVEGETIQIDWRYADGQDERLADLAEELVVNLKTAGALGLTIPQAVLQQATEIVQ